MIRQGVKLARSDEGRKLVAQAKKIAAGPEARKLASQAARAARHVGEAATRPEHRQRVKAAVKVIRKRAAR
jgi:hypothetical protein